MAVRVVTDSTSDIPQTLVEELGITLVPLFVHFGEEGYRDRVEIDADTFYQRLTQSRLFPTTSVPPPSTFLEVYQELAKDAEGIVSVHISSKLSGTWSSAKTAAAEAALACPLEVVDSGTATMALGLVVIEAARAAQRGASFEEVLEVTRGAMQRSRLFFMVETLEYLQKGGRIGRARSLLGTLIQIKPILTVRDGEVHPARQVRTRAKAVEALYEMVVQHQPFQALSVLYTTDTEDARTFRDRLAAHFPAEQIIVARAGPVIGAHVGPGGLGAAFLMNHADQGG
jgi:DegV family protein with EDD domain